MKKQKKWVQPAVTEKRFEIGFHLLNQWLCMRQNEKTLLPFFEDNFIESVAIYGMGALGERLYDELQGSPVTVRYAIDRMAASKKQDGLKIYSADADSLPETDAVVVTPVQDYAAIMEFLEMKTDAAILSLKDIIEYCMSGD